MKEITLLEKKEILLNALKEIDSFCEKNGLTYYLVGGSMIGAVRHKGFIPWDDDVDIGLLRKDYERFISEFNGFSKNLKVVDYRNTKNYIWCFGKVINTGTVQIESGIKKATIGVGVDVFPLDMIKGSKKSAERAVKKICLWKNVLTLKYMPYVKERGIIKNAIVFFGRALYLVPDKLVIKKIEKLSRKNENDENCEFVCNCAGAWGIKEIVKKEDFNSAIKCEFEDFKFNIPVGYDDYLRTVYGDYMTPPPIEKRVSTHTTKEYWIE